MAQQIDYAKLAADAGAKSVDYGALAKAIQSASTEPPNMQAQGGDTINGVDPNASPGLAQRIVRGSLESMAHPQSLGDLIGVGGLSSAPIAEHLLPKVVAPVVDTAGRGLSALGQAFKSTGKYLGVGDVLYHRGGLAEGAAVAAAPYALDLAGQAAQKGAAILRRDAPLLQFKLGGAVEAPTAEAMQAARAAAPPVTQVHIPANQPIDPVMMARQGADISAPAAVQATTAAAKPILNAAEMNEYLRLLRAGKSHPEAIEAIEAQRAFAERFGLPSADTVRTTRGTNKERILRNTP